LREIFSHAKAQKTPRKEFKRSVNLQIINRI
jgi:hypothetical protein